MFRTLKLN